MIYMVRGGAGLGFLGHCLFKTQAPKVQEVRTMCCLDLSLARE